jgi:transposase InsO family protein
MTGGRRDTSRGAGWGSVHVGIDDASRLAYGEVLPDERKEHAVPFLERAVGWFADQGVRIERVVTDHGSAYRSRQWRAACGALALRHLRTKPHTPRTNGKAERFIQTGLREWAYARTYATSAERTAALAPFLRPDLSVATTGPAGRRQERRRRPAPADAQRPSAGPSDRSRSNRSVRMPEYLNNVRGNDS